MEDGSLTEVETVIVGPDEEELRHNKRNVDDLAERRPIDDGTRLSRGQPRPHKRQRQRETGQVDEAQRSYSPRETNFRDEAAHD